MEQSHNLENSLALLARFPSVLDTLLRDMPEVWSKRNEGGETYSPLVVVSHLIQAERPDWMPRVHSILEHGDARELPRFGRDPEEADRLATTLEPAMPQFA